MLIPHGTIVALVDGAKFELYRNHGDEAHPELSDLPAPQLDTENRSGGSHRSSGSNHADSLVAEDAHAIAAAQWLNGQVLGHKIGNLIVVAAPRTLGEMRKHYHKQLGQVLQAEIAKDLAGRKPADILAALREKR